MGAVGLGSFWKVIRVKVTEIMGTFCVDDDDDDDERTLGVWYLNENCPIASYLNLLAEFA